MLAILRRGIYRLVKLMPPMKKADRIEREERPTLVIVLAGIARVRHVLKLETSHHAHSSRGMH